MGNGAINCCEASSSTMLDEVTMLSPRNLKSPSKQKLINEVSCRKSLFIQENCENRNGRSKFSHNSLVLQIKVVNSGPIQKDTRFSITPSGLENSKRNSEDGRVYFGCKRKENKAIVNDVVISVSDKAIEEHHRGRHFVIFYSIESNTY